MTTNSRLEATGKAERLEGKIQTKVSQVGKEPLENFSRSAALLSRRKGSETQTEE